MSAFCLLFWYYCQLFVYIVFCLYYGTSVNCLFTSPMSAVVYNLVSGICLHYTTDVSVCLHYTTDVSCLFTFMIPLFAVCLHFWYLCQLFVYITVPMSAVCLHFGTFVSCLFTLQSAVCLQFVIFVSCLFTLTVL